MPAPVLTAPILRDGRILAALRFVDAVTGEGVKRALTVRSDRLRFTRNLSGLYAVTGFVSDGSAGHLALEAHLRAFDAAPAQPAAGSVSLALTVEDPAGRYLPRVATVALPRGDDWNQAVEVALYPSAAAPLSPNWSGIRASLSTVDGPLAGARVRLIRASDQAPLGTGYSDARGEVLAIAPGIPVIDFTAPTTGNGNGNGQPPPAQVGTTSTQATIAIETGPGRPFPPDPQAIETTPQAWQPTQGAMPTPELRTGRLVTAGLTLTLQPSP